MHAERGTVTSLPSRMSIAVALLTAGIVFLTDRGGMIEPSRAHAAGISYEFRSQSQSARAWLESQRFEFEMDAADPGRARIGLDDSGLVIETFGRAEPLIARRNINVPQPVRLTITWGVNRYPAGANWDVGANNEAIMVMIWFGTQEFPGGFFMPPSPYFIGFFLCDKGRRKTLITGRSFQMQGRYVCVDGPPPGQEITSVIMLDEAFRAAFGRSPPAVSGFGFEADTTQVSPNARSSAWIKSIKIMPPE